MKHEGDKLYLLDVNVYNNNVIKSLFVPLTGPDCTV
jgi:hypothetical protein